MGIQVAVGEALAVGRNKLDKEGQCADKARAVIDKDSFNLAIVLSDISLDIFRVVIE